MSWNPPHLTIVRFKPPEHGHRTTLVFWTMNCSDVHPSQRSEFPGGPS